MSKYIDNNPWAGLSSYEDPEKAEREGRKPKLFCGRDDESDSVEQLIAGNIFVTIYGKSGTGKTSLLNAGVFPRLRKKRYLPISIRLSMDAMDISFQQCIIKKLSQALENANGHQQTINVVPLTSDEQQPDYLWSYFARTRLTDNDGRTLFPVMVFDQFEEVFRNRRNDAETLLRQIAYLMDESHALPPRILEGLSYKYDFNFRFVASIREDDLYQLEDSIDNNYLPELKRCRYRLRSLEQGAVDAILIPGEKFIKTEEQNDIVRAIIENSKNEDGSISTNIISLLCSRIFVDYQKTKADHISLLQVKNFIKGNPFERFIKEATQDLSNKELNYLEDNLIDSSGRRNSISENDFKKKIRKHKELLEGDTRILQCTSISSDGKRIELIHDSFCEPLLKLKEKRKRRHAWRITTITLSLVALVCILGYVVYLQSSPNIIRLKEIVKNNSILFGPIYSIPSGTLFLENDSIGYSAFYSNTDIKILHVGSNVTINDNAFGSCPNLESLYLDGNNIKIGCGVFSNCKKLKRIYVSDVCDLSNIHDLGIDCDMDIIDVGNNPKFEANVGHLFFNDQGRKVELIGGISYYFNDSTISLSTFKSDNISPSNIDIPANTEYIHLTKITDIPSDFYQDSGINYLSLPLATQIGNRAFIGSRLYSIYLPKVEKIGIEAFRGSMYNFPAEHSQSIELPNAKIIEDGAFEGCNADYIYVPVVQKIGVRTFSKNNKIRRLELPQVQEIGESSFEECSNLRYISIPSAQSIGKNSFLNCPYLDTIITSKLISKELQLHPNYYGIKEMTTNIINGQTILTPNYREYVLSEKEDIDSIQKKEYVSSLFIPRNSMVKTPGKDNSTLIQSYLSVFPNLQEVSVGIGDRNWFSYKNVLYHRGNPEDGVSKYQSNSAYIMVDYVPNVNEIVIMGSNLKNYVFHKTVDKVTHFAPNMIASVEINNPNGTELVVPYGYGRICENYSSLKNFKKISELSMLQTVYYKIGFQWKKEFTETYRVLHKYFWPIIVLFVLFLFFYYIAYDIYRRCGFSLVDSIVICAMWLLSTFLIFLVKTSVENFFNMNNNRNLLFYMLVSSILCAFHIMWLLCAKSIIKTKEVFSSAFLVVIVLSCLRFFGKFEYDLSIVLGLNIVLWIIVIQHYYRIVISRVKLN